MPTSIVDSEPQERVHRQGTVRRDILLERLAEILPLIVLTLGYYAVGLIAAMALGWPVHPHPGTAGLMVLSMLAWLLLSTLLITIPFLTLLFVLRMGYDVLDRRFPVDLNEVVRFLLKPRAMATAFSVLLVYSVFIAMFVAFKRAIPEVVPFFLDDFFMRMDRMIHFGHHPWRLLQPVLGRPEITDAIDRIYYVWFPVNYLCLLAFAWSQDRVLRIRFYLTFWLVWIVLGTVAAYALSSAGPCYFGFVTAGTDPFEPLMDYLRRVDASHRLIAVYVQQELWADYAREEAHLLMKGISAMPSVHVALPILYTLAGWRVHRGIGVAFAVYALLIFLGSIHLGWHYAVDGYVSAVCVVFLWIAAGKLSSWYSRTIEAWRGRREVTAHIGK